MRITKTEIEGLLVVEREKFYDRRGWFCEEFNLSEFVSKSGVLFVPVQDNCSFSVAGVFRGMHFQARPHAQAKMIGASSGSIMDFVVDMRSESPTFARLFSIRLSEENGKTLFVPAGFLHGFYAEEASVVRYKCDDYYCRDACRTVNVRSIMHDDELAAYGIDGAALITSDADANGIELEEVNLSEI